jgi:hypothetical protein
MGKEKEQGRNLVDAAKKEGVQHLVYSSLPNVQEVAKGINLGYDCLTLRKIPCPSFFR